MVKKRRKAIALGVSLLLAATSIGCSSGQEIANDTKHLPEEEPEIQPPKLLSDKDFLALVNDLNPNLDQNTLELIAGTIEKYSDMYNVPTNLIISVIAAESEFHPQLKGSLDDTGLMQIRLKYAPYWAKMMEVAEPKNREELFNIDTNIHMGTFILKRLLNRYSGNMEKVLVAYNAGETYVDKKIQAELSLPKHYVNRVSRFHIKLCNTPVSAALEY